MFSLANHKMIATKKGQYIAQVLTDETIDSAGTKKRTGVASPSQSPSPVLVRTKRDKETIERVTSKRDMKNCISLKRAVDTGLSLD